MTHRWLQVHLDIKLHAFSSKVYVMEIRCRCCIVFALICILKMSITKGEMKANSVWLGNMWQRCQDCISDPHVHNSVSPLCLGATFFTFLGRLSTRLLERVSRDLGPFSHKRISEGGWKVWHTVGASIDPNASGDRVGCGQDACVGQSGSTTPTLAAAMSLCLVLHKLFSFGKGRFECFNKMVFRKGIMETLPFEWAISK